MPPTLCPCSGLTQIVDTGSYGWGIYTAVFACIVAAGISKESWDYVQVRRKEGWWGAGGMS